jgi:2-polyprenyl-3-methyl-5-hydroxy-6-metoxy-1,4-benzoquinol methylase
MKKKEKKSFTYPEKITEVFDGADFHIKYCLSFIKRYLHGDTLEVGAGCGSFTRYYENKKISSITLTEKDKKNILTLSEKFKNDKKIKVVNKYVYNLVKKFDVILYLHVLEHIKDDHSEIKAAIKRLKKNGSLIILVPAHNKMYSNLDKIVGHYRRYELNFFQKKFKSLRQIDLKYLDSSGYVLYFLNKLMFKKEKYPSKFKIFIWDKFFTPVSIILDFILRYRFGKCILAVYKKY